MLPLSIIINNYLWHCQLGFFNDCRCFLWIYVIFICFLNVLFLNPVERDFRGFLPLSFETAGLNWILKTSIFGGYDLKITLQTIVLSWKVRKDLINNHNEYCFKITKLRERVLLQLNLIVVCVAWSVEKPHNFLSLKHR